MSFAGTPLGQGRRLDHHTFLGKPSSKTARPPSPARLVPTSYSHPVLTRSPSKEDVSRDNNRRSATAVDQREDNDFSRFGKNARTDLSNRPGGPKTLTSPPKNPEKWAVHDTSVNVAAAFSQAVLGDMSHNPNNAIWASSSRTLTSHVPRSTSVEYVAAADAASNRRLAAPPSRSSRGKPLSRNGNTSLHLLSEADADQSQNRSQSFRRGKSPFDTLTQAITSASFYVRRNSTEPEQPSQTQEQSYDYSAEEREFQAASRKLTSGPQRRNRISVDNKAYKPMESEDESTDEESDDNSKKRRRKKKEVVGGLLTNLPVISQDKRKKRKPTRTRKPGPGDEDEDESGSEDIGVKHQRVPVDRAGSVLSRHSVPPQEQTQYEDTSSAEQGLHMIPEDEMEEIGESSVEDINAQKPPTTASGSLLSATAGKLVYYLIFCLRGSVQILSYATWGLGLLFGSIAGIPRTLGGGNPGRGLATLLGSALALWAAYALIQNPSSIKHLIPSIPSFPSHAPVYEAPGQPAADISELNDRLLRLENTLQLIATSSEQNNAKTDAGFKTTAELAAKLASAELRFASAQRQSETANEETRSSSEQTMRILRREIDTLQGEMKEVSKGSSETVASDAEAREQLKALSLRMGTVEGDVKDALALGKQGAQPWTKKGITIKSSDGKDVTSLIGNLVDAAVSMYGKDSLGKADFALHSGGARIIPSLTSPTFEVKPQGIKNSILGLVTGNGYAVGRPPITALHHEEHNGNCWPFAGSDGRLGVALAAPAYISEFTIDHVAKEVALDFDSLRSAPRKMEVWGLLDGKDNIDKVHAWIERRRQENGEEDVSPPVSLVNSGQFVRIAEFEYNIYADSNIQTFAVPAELQELGVDFGIVFLHVESNWGRDEFTCLYRFRVHGKKMGSISESQSLEDETVEL